MKTILYISFVILSFGSFGQTLYAPGGTVTGTSAGTSVNNIGIRISNPSTRLQIQEPWAGNTPTATTADQGLLISGDQTGGAINLGIDGNGTNGLPFYSWIQSRNRNSANYYNLALNPAGGNVGVGVYNPSYKLEVGGNIVNSNPTNGWIGLTGDLPGYSPGTYGTLRTAGTYIYLSGGGRYSGYIGGSTDATLGLNDAYVNTKVVLNTNGNTYFNGGNVGIGIASPGGKLQVGGSTYIGNENGDAFYRVSIGGSGGNYGSVGYGYKYTTTSNQHTYAVADFASQLSFDVGGFSFKTAPNGTAGASVTFTDAMRILQNGNVGIKNSNPTTRLHIQEPWAGNAPTAATADQGLLISGDQTGGAINLGIDGNGTNGLPFYSWIQSRNRTSANYYNLALNPAGGNVGIGTASPDAKLTVSGQVHAQEVKVTVNAPGPDYVFEKEYKLTSLEEIKNYIDQNKHLPEVPSAKEMEKNGVQLGEMNMLLLKKIEELTLHLIEQNKKIEEQQRRLDAQEKQIQESKIK